MSSYLFAEKIDENSLLNAYFNQKTQEESIKREKEIKKKKQEKPYSLEMGMYLFRDSNINFLREIDDFIDKPYDSSEIASNGIKTFFKGEYSHKHPWIIFNLKDDIEMKYYQKYTTENRWKNSFRADAGWHGNKSRVFFSPVYVYESYSNEKLFTNEDYMLTAEYKNIGIKGHRGFMEYYKYDNRDSSYSIIKPYIFFKSNNFDFTAGYKNRDEKCRIRKYSYNLDSPFVNLRFSHDSINITAEYSHYKKNYKDIWDKINVSRSDSAEKYKISWNKDNRLYEIFTDYTAEFKTSNISEYDINLYNLEAGIRMVF